MDSPRRGTLGVSKCLLTRPRSLWRFAKKFRVPFASLGHSWSGAVALETASKLGLGVSHLALYEPMLCGLLHSHGKAEAWPEALGIYAAVQRLVGFNAC